MKIFALLCFLLAPQAWAGWSVSSYNIRNFDHDPKAGPTNLSELGNTLQAFKSDVMVFVEVVNLAAFKSVVKENLPGYIVTSSACGGFGKQKLAIVYNPKVFKFISSAEDLTFSSSSAACGSLRPVFLVTLKHKLNNKVYVFAAVHLKAGGEESAMTQRWAQYELLGKLVSQYKSHNLIMMGDFNTTGYNLKNEDFTKFDKLLSTSSLTTMSQSLSCTSYWSGTLGTGKHQSSILDHIVLEDDLVAGVQDVYFGSHCAKLDCKDATPEELGISYQTVSDHCPIQVTFK
ncbi:MAG: endonuclease/exonuclease/phosphatase family protein [Bdellovibrionales bacterium]|nr:endonuclease/exonuclease/phosphatase family protein [Bdellovibrionales bacterium]